MEGVSEPSVLGMRLANAREATREVFGDAGVEDVLGRLGDDERGAFLPGAKLRVWEPDRLLVAWVLAVWEGPCGRSRPDLARWAGAITGRGFGRARRVLISIASPWTLLRRAEALWRGEHTHGTLTVVPVGSQGARVTLRGHLLAQHAVTRDVMAEAFRYIVQLCWVHEVTETHEHKDDAVHVLVSWR